MSEYFKEFEGGGVNNITPKIDPIEVHDAEIDLVAQKARVEEEIAKLDADPNADREERRVLERTLSNLNLNL
jgi:hypothetical protein